MAYDEMELDLLGDRRTALFVIISDTDDTFNFVVSIMYTQLFNLLCDRADDQCGGQLKYHVRLLLDEFANIGLIPKFDKLIATIRSREISASIILQSQSQLKTIYKDAAETIIGNCDTMLFLGGKVAGLFPGCKAVCTLGFIDAQPLAHGGVADADALRRGLTADLACFDFFHKGDLLLWRQLWSLGHGEHLKRVRS